MVLKIAKASAADAEADDLQWDRIVQTQARRCRTEAKNAAWDKRYTDIRLTPQQAKLLECVYYGQGAMYGASKLYDYVSRLDKDSSGQTKLRPGDTVLLQDEQGDRIKPLNVTYRVAKVYKPRKEDKGKTYAIELKNGTKDNKRYKRSTLRLVTGITRRQVLGWLKHQLVWQLTTRPRKGYRPDRPFTQSLPGKTLQVDLIYIMNEKDTSVEGAALNVIDIYSRMAWSTVIARKQQKSSSKQWKAQSMTAAIVGKKFASLLNEYIFPPDSIPFPAGVRISCDNGPEFGKDFRKTVNAYAQSRGQKVAYKYGIPNVPTSQAYIERFNQTVKAMMYKLRSSQRSRGWEYNLQVATRKYNKTPHTLHGQSPAALWREVQNDPEKGYIKTEKKTPSIAETPLKLNDFVRVKRGKKDTAHYYRRNYTEQIFQIERVRDPKKTDSARYGYTLKPFTDTNTTTYVRGLGGKKPIVYLRHNLLHIPSGTPYKSPLLKIRQGNVKRAPLDRLQKWCAKCTTAL